MPCPTEIEVLLAFWYDPNADLRNWNPGQRDYIRRLINKEILSFFNHAGDPRIGANRPALEPYIEVITSVPLPKRKTVWTIDP